MMKNKNIKNKYYNNQKKKWKTCKYKENYTIEI